MSAALHSDHVNLLVFRYLQESGFENAARSLVSDWRRPAEHHDPETLPFAHEVQRHALVSVIQNGLHHDDLLVRRCNKERRFRWAGVDSRDSIERRDGHLENGVASRPASSKGRKGRSTEMRPPNEFPPSAPRRGRRSEGSDANVNGDAMDVDAASAKSADAEDEAEAASPAVQSESEPMEVVERYDSMDVGIQVDIKRGPKTSTLQWKIDKPEATISNSSWNPDSDPKNAKSLLTVGESLCRFYEVPETTDNVTQIAHIDVPLPNESSVVTASAWRPDGRGVLYSVNGARNLSDDNTSTTEELIEHNVDAGPTTFQLGPTLIEPAGVVLSVRYSPSAEYFLLSRTNMKRGLVQVWKTTTPGADADKLSKEPIAWRIFEHHISDVAWTEDDNFLVAGNDGLAARYQVDASHDNGTSAVTAGTVAMHGLISHNSNIIDTTYDWNKVRFDRQHKIMVFASVLAKKMILTPELEDGKINVGMDAEIDLPEELTALAFRPWEKPEEESAAEAQRDLPSLLAAGYLDGSCIIYNVSQTSEGGAKCAELAVLSMEDGPAAALAWSPNGEQIAIGNADRVQIWTAESLKRKNGVRHMPSAAVIWKPAPETNGTADGDQEASQEESEPSLSWSADGESLAFAADKQIAVIRFRPSFNASADDVDMNGGPSP